MSAADALLWMSRGPAYYVLDNGQLKRDFVLSDDTNYTPVIITGGKPYYTKVSDQTIVADYSAPVDI